MPQAGPSTGQHCFGLAQTARRQHLCVWVCIYLQLVSPGNRFYLAAVCLPGILSLFLSVWLSAWAAAYIVLVFLVVIFAGHYFIQDKNVYHVLMLLSLYAAFFMPSFYYLFRIQAQLIAIKVDPMCGRLGLVLCTGKKKRTAQLNIQRSVRLCVCWKRHFAFHINHAAFTALECIACFSALSVRKLILCLIATNSIMSWQRPDRTPAVHAKQAHKHHQQQQSTQQDTCPVNACAFIMRNSCCINKNIEHTHTHTNTS